MRRNDGQTCPIGILPVGRTNSISHGLFNLSGKFKNNVEEVKNLADAAISVVRGQIQKKDAIKIELVAQEDSELPLPRAIYALGSLKWGAFHEIRNKRDKYWYTNGLREYFAFLLNSFSNAITWKCRARIIYTDPCPGCKNCRIRHDAVKTVQNTRWWAKFIPRAKPVQTNEIDYSKIVNENCNNTHELEIESTEFELNTRIIEPSNIEVPKLTIRLSGVLDNGFGYMFDAWKRVKSQNQQLVECSQIIDAKSVEILPETEETTKDRFFSIDNEDFEVKPIKIVILPEAVEMFVLNS